MKRRARLAATARAARGYVLPTVLVMLVLMSIAVLSLIRRGTLDELLASNVRQITTLDTAAQLALRTCERLLWASPPGIVPQAGMPDPPPLVAAAAPNGTPAWMTAANWTNAAVALPVADFNANLNEARCLFEDATTELELGSANPSGTANTLNLESTWRKYRITAEVRSGTGFGRAQAEVRMNVFGS
jgi:Tfp pilus assembly protein PilX